MHRAPENHAIRRGLENLQIDSVDLRQELKEPDDGSLGVGYELFVKELRSALGRNVRVPRVNLSGPPADFQAVTDPEQSETVAARLSAMVQREGATDITPAPPLVEQPKDDFHGLPHDESTHLLGVCR
jgi:hypothetical protein